MEALTEDESLKGIKEAPSLIIPWWDASIPICHSYGAGCHTGGGQGTQGEGHNLLQPFLEMTVVKHTKTALLKYYVFVRLKYQENGKNGKYNVPTTVQHLVSRNKTDTGGCSKAEAAPSLHMKEFRRRYLFLFTQKPQR